MEGFFVSSILMGALFGSLYGVYHAGKYGRKSAIMLCCSIALVTALLMAMSVGSYGMVSFFRLISGFATGISAVVGPMYISEIAPTEKRDAFGTLYATSICLNVLVAQFLNAIFNLLNLPCVTLGSVSAQFLFCALPPAALIAYCYWRLPETDAWLNRGEAEGVTSILAEIKTWSVLLESEHCFTGLCCLPSAVPAVDGSQRADILWSYNHSK